MKSFRNPFASRNKNNNNNTMQNEQNRTDIENQSEEELKLQSEVEASEQKPMEENPVERLTAELAEQKDQHMRLYAEFDNFRKRSMKERADYLKSAGSDVIISLLPIIDDFERALKASAHIDEKEPMKEGMTLVYHKLKLSLEQKGLKAMNTIGTDFDVDVHEAITNIPAGDDMKGKVVDELEKGYWFNDKVIRHAKVVVGS